MQPVLVLGKKWGGSGREGVSTFGSGPGPGCVQSPPRGPASAYRLNCSASPALLGDRGPHSTFSSGCSPRVRRRPQGGWALPGAVQGPSASSPPPRLCSQTSPRVGGAAFAYCPHCLPCPLKSQRSRGIQGSSWPREEGDLQVGIRATGAGLNRKVQLPPCTTYQGSSNLSVQDSLPSTC